MTKSDITNALHKALDKTHKVLTANSNKPMPRGLVGMTDHVIINRHGAGIWWIEIKIGNDKLSEEQEEFKAMIEKQEKKSKGVICYRIIEINKKVDNLAEVINEIYGK